VAFASASCGRSDQMTISQNRRCSFGHGEFATDRPISRHVWILHDSRRSCDGAVANRRPGYVPTILLAVLAATLGLTCSRAAPAADEVGSWTIVLRQLSGPCSEPCMRATRLFVSSTDISATCRRCGTRRSCLP